MNSPSKVESILLAALEQATPEARSAYVDDVCQDDPGLLEQVNRLLAAHPKAIDFLEMPLAAVEEKTAMYVPTVEKPGSILVGRYKLLERIGEGGMGTVWFAQQTEPVKRMVAVKLIKAGMDSKAVLARFEAERQALALMDHPNIARVLDGGAMPDGRPFFVMELVKGVPITQFCDARRLTPQQRLELFVPVCQAIQHAHHKGVIHRDIKPSNVLIALYDDKPVPKVIDFGIAKAAGQTLTDLSLMTGFGSVVGTPEYMSPEQASLNNLDIDTRSDVYSLGALLYELLAGSPPFHSDELKKAGLLEMLRVVREEEPPRPSIKFSTANKFPSISADRGTEPKKLAGLLRNELDWIVMKSLEKDRTRRYDSATAFAKDVQRYLAGEAVQAHPPSVWYQFSKMVRKNKREVAVAAIVLMLLFLGVAGTTWQAGERRREREIRQLQASQAAISGADRATAALEANRLFEVDTALAMIDDEQISHSPELQDRVDSLRRDRKMMEKLENLSEGHWNFAPSQNSKEAEKPKNRYPEVFRDYGIAIDQLNTDEAADRVRQSRIAPALTDALTTWFFLVRDNQRLKLLLDRLDTDEYRTAVRTAELEGTGDRARELAHKPDALLQSPVFAVMLSNAVYAEDRCLSILKATWSRYPYSFPVAFALANRIEEDTLERRAWKRTAVALRPKSALANYELSTEYRQGPIPGVDPPYPPFVWVGFLGPRNDEQTGYRIECLKRAVESAPQWAGAHADLGNAFSTACRFDEATESYKRALELDPGNYVAFVGLLYTYGLRENWGEAARIHCDWIALGLNSRDYSQPDATLDFRVRNAIYLSYMYAQSVHLIMGELGFSRKLAKGLIQTERYNDLVKLGVAAKGIKFHMPSNGSPDVLEAQMDSSLDIRMFLPACAAVQASCGHGINPPLPQERPAVRRQALEWLTNDLKACETKYLADKAKLASILHATMNRWLSAPMLADVRGERIAELSKDERKAWEALWIKVAGLRDQTVPTQIPAKE